MDKALGSRHLGRRDSDQVSTVLVGSELPSRPSNLGALIVRPRVNHLHIPILCLETSGLSADSLTVAASQVSTSNKSFICT